jgi:phenylacetate-CoA ligase
VSPEILDSPTLEARESLGIDSADYETLRLRQLSDALERLPEDLRHVKWSRERIKEERQRRLRDLVRVAKEKSPWHARRLGSVDAESITEADLVKLPVMTKADLMTNFDRIVTDNRLTLEVVNAHVAGLTKDKYLFDNYHVVASGGTSGFRGVFVYNWDEWITLFLTARWAFLSLVNPVQLRLLSFGPVRRLLVRSARSAKTKTQRKGGFAVVMAEIASHMENAQLQTFQPWPALVLPASLPIAEIVQKLNSVRPERLSVYPSTLYLLALEAKAGRLRIRPKFIGTAGEPLTARVREAVRDVWNLDIFNYWGASEGGQFAVSCGKSESMHLNEDLHIIEAVDANGRPVSPGMQASKIYLTNLFNHTMPLIRYEIADKVTLLSEQECPCGSIFRQVGDVEGRQEDSFLYPGDVMVDPLVFESTFQHYPSVVEYQVTQTPKGASLSLVTQGPVDLRQLETDLCENLERSGLHNPELSARVVDRLERTHGVAKLKRFVPLAIESRKVEQYA